MPTVTLADLQQRIYDRLENNTLFYPAAHLVKYINDAIRIVNLYTGLLQGSASIIGGSVAGQLKYTVPASILIPVKIEYGGRKIDELGFDAAGESRPRWSIETVNMVDRPTDAWIPIGITQFCLSPIPSVSGIPIIVTGITEPTPLVNPTDTISYPNQYGSVIEDLVSHVLPLKEGGFIFQQASVLYVSFLSKMKEMKRFQNMRFPQFWVEQQQSK